MRRKELHKNHYISPKAVHHLINKERRKRNIPYVKWSQEMYHLAKSQADYCRRVKHMVHSNRYALQGGENLFYCGGNTTPKAVVDTWMHSKDGHREWLLDPRVKCAGVGVSNSKRGVYVAWAFSSSCIVEGVKSFLGKILKK